MNSVELAGLAGDCRGDAGQQIAGGRIDTGLTPAHWRRVALISARMTGLIGQLEYNDDAQNVTANFETSEALGREDTSVAAPLRPEPLPHSSVPVAAVSPWPPPAAARGVVVRAVIVGMVPAPAVPGMRITPAMPAPAPAAAPTTPIDILYVGAEDRLF